MQSISDEPARNTQRGLGLAVAIPADVILAAAQAAQENGYHSFWLNNPPRTNALEVLGRAARSVPSIRLGVGVIPLSDFAPEDIIREVQTHGLPLDRFDLGIGSGAGPGSVERVAAGIRAIRSDLDCRLVVAAMGPRMCRLAGAEADGVLFNWLTPEFARRSTEWVREGAEGAGRAMPRLMAYVRAALGAGAKSRLEREAGNYEAIPHYAAHFNRMGVSAADTAVTGAEPQEIQRSLAAWNGEVDEVVVRAITAQDTIEDVRMLLEAARPGRRTGD